MRDTFTESGRLMSKAPKFGEIAKKAFLLEVRIDRFLLTYHDGRGLYSFPKPGHAKNVEIFNKLRTETNTICMTPGLASKMLHNALFAQYTALCDLHDEIRLGLRRAVYIENSSEKLGQLEMLNKKVKLMRKVTKELASAISWAKLGGEVAKNA